MNAKLKQWAASIAERKPSVRFARLDQFAVRHGYPGWEEDMRHYYFCEEMIDAANTICKYILAKAVETIPVFARIGDVQLAGDYVRIVEEVVLLWDTDRTKAILKDCLADLYESELRKRKRGVPVLILDSYHRPYKFE